MTTKKFNYIVGFATILSLIVGAIGLFINNKMKEKETTEINVGIQNHSITNDSGKTQNYGVVQGDQINNK